MSTYKIFSWNVNGIRAVAKKGFSDWFESTKPDILCLQETKAQDEQIPKNIKFEGYELIHNAAEKKGYSGVLTYSKIKPKEVKFGIGVKEYEKEGRVIITKYEEFTLINVYFPNGKKDDERLQFKMDFYQHTLDLLKRLRKAGEKTIVCGDVNTAHKEKDLANPKPNSKYSGFLPQEREWIDNLISEGWVDSLRNFTEEPELYTWWSVRSGARERNVGWRIDYFFVDKDLLPHLKAAEIHSSVMGSDHCPISITLEF